MENWFQIDSLVIEHHSNCILTRRSFIKCIFFVLLLFVISFYICKSFGFIIHFEVTTEENEIPTVSTNDGESTISLSTDFISQNSSSPTSIENSTNHWNPI